VLPLLIALAWIGLKSLIARPVILRRVAVCYGTAFCLFGAVAMGYSLWDQNRAAKASREWMIAQPEFERGYEHFGGVLNFPH
jgi:arginine exporter protein ArgO